MAPVSRDAGRSCAITQAIPGSRSFQTGRVGARVGVTHERVRRAVQTCSTPSALVIESTGPARSDPRQLAGLQLAGAGALFLLGDDAEDQPEDLRRAGRLHVAGLEAFAPVAQR